jgi:hypothetical protein
LSSHSALSITLMMYRTAWIYTISRDMTQHPANLVDR